MGPWVFNDGQFGLQPEKKIKGVSFPNEGQWRTIKMQPDDIPVPPNLPNLLGPEMEDNP